MPCVSNHETTMDDHDLSQPDHSSAAEARVGPVLDLGRPDDLLRLMRVEGAGAGRPAFRQNLHGEQFGVDFRFERAGRANRAGGAVVGFHGFVGPEGHIPDIGLCHCCITRRASESFVCSQRHPVFRKAADRTKSPADSSRHLRQLSIGSEAARRHGARKQGGVVSNANVQ